MRERDASPDLDWLEGDVPVSRRFNDPYYSITEGLAESRHVFLGGNDLARRWKDCGDFLVAELGFGTGLNFLAALELWRRTAAKGAVLDFVSFEIEPLDPAQMRRALGVWPEIAEDAARLAGEWRGGGTIAFDGARLEVVIGDARRTVPAWTGEAGAWFLDGFAPARNPEMWEPDLMRSVFEHTLPGGTVATYSAAGSVRRTLSDAGFRVLRRPGFGTKRDMSIGRRPACD